MAYTVILYVYHQKQKDVLETVCRIPMITSAKEEQRMIATCRKVVCKFHLISPSSGLIFLLVKFAFGYF